MKKIFNLFLIVLLVASVVSAQKEAIIDYKPTDPKLEINEKESIEFSVTVGYPNVELYAGWKLNDKLVKKEVLKPGRGGRTTTYNQYFNKFSSGRHKVEVTITTIDRSAQEKKSWIITVNNVDDACGDGIWNIGEDINNCPQDSNEYSIAPSDEIDVLDTGSYTVGMYCFPGWHHDPVFLRDKGWWKTIIEEKVKYPGQEQPKIPITNYYDTTNSVTVDWTIKWALEHGVSLFVFNWYDSYFGEVPIDVFLEEFDRKYKKYKDDAKFMLQWSNHVAPEGTVEEKEEAALKTLDRAEEKYFRHPQYLKINDKPVFIIFNWWNLLQESQERTNELLKKMNTRMKEKGYDGLYILLVTEGCKEGLALDAITAYNYAGKMKMPTDTYDNYVQTYSETWQTIYDRCEDKKNFDGNSINFFLPVSTGWDNFPWEEVYGEGMDDMYISAILDSTPDKFKTMLQNAKDFVTEKDFDPKIIIINAWDEWGEGSVLYPRADKWGFGYLEAVRSVFGKELCGNGECKEGETPENCPEDCKPTEVSLKLFYGGEGNPSCFSDLDNIISADSASSMNDAEYECYVNSLKEQRMYSNAADIYLDYDANGILSPKEVRIKALDEAGYGHIILWFKNEIWDLSEENRAKVYTKLKEVNGFDKINEIVIVDEPYFNKWSFEKLKRAINEAKQNFPNKKLRINFAAKVTLPGYKIPEEIDAVSFDYYPWFLNSDDACEDETTWKQIIQDLTGKIKAKTNKPIIYIAQGFTGREGERYCPLTADNVRWSYEVADANNLQGLSYWFPRGTKKYGQVVFTGYREPENEEAEQEIIKIGKEIIKHPTPPDSGCGDGICDESEENTCPEDCKECVPEWGCKLEPATCPSIGIQNKVCYDIKCGTGEKRTEAIKCEPGSCGGCLADGTCYPVMSRMLKAEIPNYCDITKTFAKQKDLGSPCQNDYECLTNECSSGECIDIKKELEETRSLLKKVLEWLRHIFGG